MEEHWTLATGMEHMALQGFLVHEPPGPFGLSKLTELLRKKDPEDLKHMAGDGMHLVTQASFMFYILANISMKDELAPSQPEGSATFWEALDEDEDWSPDM